jgi:type IV secretion system protein VirB10
MTEQPTHEEAAAEEIPAPQLRLRSTPPQVMRLSRKVLAGMALVAGISVGGALIYALQGRHGDAPQTELYNTDQRTTPDGLASMPRDYAHVPQLGAPLPGDLGRPILKAQGQSPVAAPIDPVQQRIAQEQETARVSKLFATTAVRSAESPAVPPTSAESAAPPAAASATGPSDPTATQNMQDQKLTFLNGPTERRTASDDRLENLASPYVVQAGAVIPAALITGIRSDLPGLVTAQVTEPVYDSPSGHYLLIPQGARLIGQYDSQISFAQSRVQLVWTRLILPNGKSIVLERQPGADAGGYSGLEDEVDNHWGTLFKAALLSTVLSVGAEAGTSDSENNLAQAIRMGASNSISQTGQQIVERNLNVQPTLTIRPGFPVRVIVNRDLVLTPYR